MIVRLAAVGSKVINSSHIVVKRKAPDSSDGTGLKISGEEEISGIYAAPGDTSSNSTHIIKMSKRNKTTAVINLGDDGGGDVIASRGSGIQGSDELEQVTNEQKVCLI
jgi:hypothetical protein